MGLITDHTPGATPFSPPPAHPPNSLSAYPTFYHDAPALHIRRNITSLPTQRKNLRQVIVGVSPASNNLVRVAAGRRFRCVQGTERTLPGTFGLAASKVEWMDDEVPGRKHGKELVRCVGALMQVLRVAVVRQSERTGGDGWDGGGVGGVGWGCWGVGGWGVRAGGWGGMRGWVGEGVRVRVCMHARSRAPTYTSVACHPIYERKREHVHHTSVSCSPSHTCNTHAC